MKLELDLTKEELLKLKDIVVQKYIKLTDHLSILYQRQTDYYDRYDIDKVEKEVNLIQPIVKELENKLNELELKEKIFKHRIVYKEHIDSGKTIPIGSIDEFGRLILKKFKEIDINEPSLYSTEWYIRQSLVKDNYIIVYPKQIVINNIENKINEINVTKDGKLYVLGFLTNDYKLFYYDQFN